MQRPAPFLWKSRHGIYYFRLITPKAIKATHPEINREYRCSLKTRCPNEALTKARLMWAAVFGNRDELNHSKLKQMSTTILASTSPIPISYKHYLKEIAPMALVRKVQMNETIEGNEWSSEDFMTSAPPTSEPSKPHYSELFKLYTEDQQSSQKWSIKTTQENTAIMSLFIRIEGDLSINRYRRDNFVHFKQTIQKIPKNLNKDPRFRDRTISEITKMPEIAVLDLITVNKYLARTRAFFAWCSRNQYIEYNPADGLSIRINKHPRDHRDDFSSDELSALLSGNVYREAVRPIPYRFWLSLLAMYTGARLDELCQLHTDDIMEIDGIWCFSFNDSGQKKLKNLSSFRTIPIHSKLIALGFLNFVSQKRQRGDRRLFTELRWRELDGYQRNASKWFSGYRRECGITSKKKTFHSFRHTVSNYLKQSGCNIDQVSALVGHSTGTITFDRYGKQYNPSVMQKLIEQIDYGISFEHLMNPSVNPYFII